jgi:hypothetical protein
MFLKLVELKNQNESVIEFTDSYFTVNVEKLYNYLKNQDPELLYSIENNSAIIYTNQKVIKRGYIWNSSSVKRVNLYKITEMNQLLINGTNDTNEIPKTHAQLKKEVLDEIKNGKKLIPINYHQYGLGYASNLITTQFPLTEYKYPNELSRELLSKMKYLRMCKSDSESESECEIEYAEYQSI